MSDHKILTRTQFPTMQHTTTNMSSLATLSLNGYEYSCPEIEAG